MWTQHRINTEKLYLLTWEKKNMDTEGILVAIYISLINMVNAFTRLLPTFKKSYLFYRKLLQVKKVFEIFCFCRRLSWQMINTRLLKGNRLFDMLQKGLDLKKEALAQVLSCKICEIFKNPFFTEHLRTTASMTLKYEIPIVKSSHQRCSIKKVFLKISQNSQEKTCASLFFNKVSSRLSLQF